MDSSAAQKQTEEKQELMAAADRAIALSKEDSVFLNVAKFEQMQRVAMMLSKSDFVPSRFRNNVGNCMIALDMASLMGMHPVMLMRTMYIVHGEPGFEGKFISALINNSNRYTDPLEYEWRAEKGKPQWGCRAYATRRSTQKVVYGPWVDWAMVQAEGWHKPKGNQPSKWTTMPEIMFHYRAATFFGRVNDSDLLLGMKTIEELEEIQTDLRRQPDGSFAFAGSVAPDKKPTAATYTAIKQAPPPPPPETPPHGEKTDHEPISDQGAQSSADPKPTAEVGAVDDFGTPHHSYFEKSKWWNLRAGSIKDGTGFRAYVQAHARALSDVSDKAWEALNTKYQKFYGRPMPWGRDGLITKADADQGTDHVTDTESDPGSDQPPSTGEAPPEILPSADQESNGHVLDSDAAQILARLAKEHPDHYKCVVRGRMPETVPEIMRWIDEINELVVGQRTYTGHPDDTREYDRF